MIKKTVLYAAFTVLLLITFFTLGRSNLAVHVIVEAPSPMKHLIHIQIDNETVFKDEVNSGVLSSKKIMVENMSMGFHMLKIEAIKDSIVYREERFFLFNQSLIINYFCGYSSEIDESSLEEEPCFYVWSKFGKFFID